jgi:hypothetical protein
VFISEQHRRAGKPDHRAGHRIQTQPVPDPQHPGPGAAHRAWPAVTTTLAGPSDAECRSVPSSCNHIR